MPAWTVRVEAHEVVGPARSYVIPARETFVGGRTMREARMQACRDVHVRHGLPPWRPYLRQSWPHVTVAQREDVIARYMAERAKGAKRVDGA